MPAETSDSSLSRIRPMEDRVFVDAQTLLAVPLSASDWTYLDCFKEDWDGIMMMPGGWGRMIDGKHVVVVLNRCGDYHPTWRMYVDGAFVEKFDDINVIMGSGRDAMRVAEKFFQRSHVSASAS